MRHAKVSLGLPKNMSVCCSTGTRSCPSFNRHLTGVMHHALLFFIENQTGKVGCTSHEANTTSRVTGSTHAYLTKIHEILTIACGVHYLTKTFGSRICRSRSRAELKVAFSWCVYYPLVSGLFVRVLCLAVEQLVLSAQILSDRGHASIPQQFL